MTTLYLLLVFTYRGDWIPGPEFKIQSECEAVLHQLNLVRPQIPSWADLRYKKAKCLPIKKTL